MAKVSAKDGADYFLSVSDTEEGDNTSPLKLRSPRTIRGDFTSPCTINLFSMKTSWRGNTVLWSAASGIVTKSTAPKQYQSPSQELMKSYFKTQLVE